MSAKGVTMNEQPKQKPVSLFRRLLNVLKGEGLKDITKGMPVFAPGRGPTQPHSSWEVMPPQPPKPKEEEPKDY
jgi:hypothetical protein